MKDMKELEIEDFHYDLVEQIEKTFNCVKPILLNESPLNYKCYEYKGYVVVFCKNFVNIYQESEYGYLEVNSCLIKEKEFKLECIDDYVNSEKEETNLSYVYNKLIKQPIEHSYLQLANSEIYTYYTILVDNEIVGIKIDKDKVYLITESSKMSNLKAFNINYFDVSEIQTYLKKQRERKQLVKYSYNLQTRLSIYKNNKGSGYFIMSDQFKQAQEDLANQLNDRVFNSYAIINILETLNKLYKSLNCEQLRLLALLDKRIV